VLRIYLYRAPIDFCNQVYGLAALIGQGMTTTLTLTVIMDASIPLKRERHL